MINEVKITEEIMNNKNPTNQDVPSVPKTEKPQLRIRTSSFVDYVYEVEGRLVLDGESIPFQTDVAIGEDGYVRIRNFDCKHPKAEQVEEIVLRRAEEAYDRCADEFGAVPELSFRGTRR